MNKFFYDKRIIYIYIVTITILTLGVTYALYTTTSYGFNTTTSQINIDEAKYGSTTFDSSELDFKPILDSEVEDTENKDNVIKIDFKVGGAETNDEDKTIIYDIALNDLDVSCDLLSPYIKWKLIKNGELFSSGSLSYTFDTIKAGRLVLSNTQQDLPDYNTTTIGYDSYTFYMWMSDSCQGTLAECVTNGNLEDQRELLGKRLQGKIEVELYTGSKKTLKRNPADTTEGLICTTGNVVTLNVNEGDAWTEDTCTSPLTLNGKYCNKDIKTNETYGNLPTPTREGYNFEGWYTKKNGGELVTSSTIIINENSHNLYAQWSLSSYNLNYDYLTNGGESTNAISTNLSINDTIDLTPTATKTGYTFIGWNTDKNAKTALTSLNMKDEDITLYAIYKKEAVTYKATTQKNVSSATGTETTISCTIDAVYNNETQATSCDITLPTNQYTLNNWTFNGWVNGESETTTTKTSGSLATSTMSISGNVNIIATWKKDISVKVTFDKNGGSSNTTSVSVTTTLYNGNTNLSTNLTFTSPTCTSRTGYKCLGYNTSSTATSSNWNEGETKQISISGTVPIDDTVYTQTSGYYHTWKANEFTINFYSNGGIRDGSTEVVETPIYVETPDYDATGYANYGIANFNNSNSSLYMTKTGYTATHYWLVGSPDSTIVIDADKTYAKTQDLAEELGILEEFENGENPVVNLYAKWTINKVNIKLSTNGGTVTSSTTSTDNTYTYTWTIDSDGIVSKSTNGGTATNIINSVNYDSTLTSAGLADWNNPNYLNITNTGYSAVTGAEWKCLSGDCEVGKTYSHSTVYAASDFCDASSGNCTVVLGVNWKANTYTVTYEGNLFTGLTRGTTNGLSTSTENGVTMTYDKETSYLTFDGTQTGNNGVSIFLNQSFTAGDQYKVSLTYISGTVTKSDSNSFAFDIQKDNSNLSTRNYASVQYPTSGTNSATLTISDLAASDGETLKAWTWVNSSGAVTFDNYVIKVVVTKVETASINYNSNYVLPSTNPARIGNTFQGWSFVPDEYQQVDYIESTGTQYIDTGFVPNDNTRVAIDYANTGSFGALFGARINTTDSVFGIWLESTTVYPHWASGAWDDYSTSITTANRTVYDMNKNYFTIGSISKTGPSAIFDSTYKLSLLAMNTGGTYDSRMASGKLYSAKIYDDGTLVRDYIPCYRKSDNVVGLYDRVNNKFYTNSGTGTFSHGTKSYITSSTKMITSSNHTIYASYSLNNYTVTYDYATNGGTSVTKTQATLNHGDSIDLTPTATKSGWTFVGWNTNKSATTGLSSLTMGTSNVTLYAIYKKTSTGTFYYYDGSAQTSTTASCTMYNTGTSCSYALPSAVSSSSGPSSTTYKGVSTSTSSTTTTTSYTSANTKYYTVYQKSITATFYYNSNTTSGSLTVATATNSGTRTATTNGTTYSTSNPNISVPSAVSSSVGKYNMPYKGVAKAGSSMSTATPTTATTTYYAVYQNNTSSNAYKIYYPTSTTAVSSITVYRNEYFTSTTAMAAAISTSSTGTSSLTSISGILGTYKGVNSSANSTSYSAASTYASSTSLSTTAAVNLYAVSTSSITATFYYSTLAATDYTYTGGAQTSTTASGTRTNYCSSTTAATTKAGNITVPDVVTSSTGGRSAQNYAGVSNSTSSATTMTPTTAYTAYYAVYTEDLTFYYYNGSAHTSTKVTRRMLSNGTTYSNSLSATAPTPSAYDSASYSSWSYTTDSVNVRKPLETGVNSLYAVYTKTITITYNANGGSGAPSASTGTKTYISKSGGVNTLNPSITLSSTKPTRTGYTFNGWNTATDGSGTSYTAGTAYTFSASDTIYAKWTVNKIYVQMHMNGGSWAGSTNTNLSYSGNYVTTNGSTINYTYSYGQTGIDLANWDNSGYINISRTGYSAKEGAEWNLKADGSGTSFPDSSATVAANDLCDASAGNCTATLYVNWTANTYTITYNANGGSGAPSAQSYTYATSGTTNLSSSIPTKSGYTFLGWSLSSTATSASYSAGQAWNLSNANNYTLYAVWKTKTCTQVKGTTSSTVSLYYDDDTDWKCGGDEYKYVGTGYSFNTSTGQYTLNGAVLYDGTQSLSTYKYAASYTSGITTIYALNSTTATHEYGGDATTYCGYEQYTTTGYTYTSSCS